MSAHPATRTEMPDVRPFSAPYAAADEDLAARFLAEATRDPAAEARIDVRAGGLIEAIRARVGGVGGIEDFLHEYSLSTKEGLALMVLAEALLGVRGNATADRLIEDKRLAADCSHRDVRSDALLVSASACALGLSARIIQAHETPERIVASLVGRLGLPAVRTATRQAMRLLGAHFVLGQSIGEALDRAAAHDSRYSFDMLGEGARTAADADRYFEAYAGAIAAIGRRGGNRALPDRHGISVKLSALHPRFEAVSRARVLRELVPRVIELARAAKDHDLNFTIDAEEADRLELTLEVAARVLADPSLAGWPGFGLAIQAYQKRGLADYPVFSRKAMTDFSYLACLRKLLAARPRIFPQIATHNALTVATAIEEAGGVEGYEFQRLHGMGEALYEALVADTPAAACRVYAPVGGHRDLLAYLVRRLLENGANSSFVSVAADARVAIADILRRPQSWIADAALARHPSIPLPHDLYEPARKNSAGVDLGDRACLDALVADIRAVAPRDCVAAPLIDGVAVEGHRRAVASPIDGEAIGEVIEGDEAIVI